MAEKNDAETTPVPARDTFLLGVSTAELAGLSVEEIKDNRTAILMMMHFFRQLSDENASLKTDVNTLRTYVEGYNRKMGDAKVGSVLLVASSILTGFGVNLLTSGSTMAGLFVFAPGLVLAVAGLYIGLKRGD
jgi:hypothetical protein